MYDIIIGRNEQDKEKYGTKGAILLGKHYVKMGRTTSLSNNILLDVISSHVIFVCGKNRDVSVNGVNFHPNRKRSTVTIRMSPS